MFRKMRRFKQALTQEECSRILKEEPRGVLALNGEDGYPYSLPITYCYDEAQNALIFHGAKDGYKLDCIRQSDKACFCVYDQGYHQEGDWALTVKSVICFGRVEIVTDPARCEDICRMLGLKMYPSAEEVEQEIRKDVARVTCLVFHIDHMTGKQVHEE